MKKFLTLLSAALIAVASLATVASAEDVYKPTVALDITNVLPNGAAQITASVKVEKELDFHNEGVGYDWYNGSGITSWQINMDLDTSIFSKETALVTGNYFPAYTNVKASVGGTATIGMATVMLNSDYKGKTVAELNALNFAEVTAAIIEITEWNGGYDVNDSSSIVSQTTYATDGNGDYGVDLSATRIGTYVPGSDEPAADVTIKGAYKTTNADWVAKKGNTLWWGVDYAAGKFPGEVEITIFSAEKEKKFTLGADSSIDVNGDVSFGVFAIVGDSTDALNIKIGDVAGAGYVAFADAPVAE